MYSYDLTPVSCEVLPKINSSPAFVVSSLGNDSVLLGDFNC